MTFEGLAEVNCSCILTAVQKAEENTSDFFSKRISDAKIANKDFKSHWERGKRPSDMDRCDKVLSYKGISVNCLRDSSDEEIMGHYRMTLAISPKGTSKYFCKFRFLPNAGKVMPTPENRFFHCNFFKADSFSKEFVMIFDVQRLI
jgi:hypothetical protein